MIAQKDHPFLSETRPVNWSSLTAEALLPDIEAALVAAEDGLSKIEGVPLEAATYETVIVAMEKATEPLSDAWNLAGHLSSVRMDDEFREAYNKALPKVSDFYAGICLREELWVRVCKIADEGPQPSDRAQQRHLAETKRDFEEAGARLSPVEKERLRTIESDLAATTQKFTENVLDSTEAWEKTVDDPSLLDGLPPTVLHAAREDAKSRGLGTEDKPVWRFSLQAPSYIPVLQYAHSEELRKEIWKAASEIGDTEKYNNRPLILEILSLRKEKTDLLGFDTFADYTTGRRMVKEGRAALLFVEDIHSRVSKKFRAEVNELEDFRAAETNTAHRKLEPWEVSYWSERLRKKLYDFEEEELRKWFPIESVQRGLFELAERVFGVEIRPKETDEGAVWDPLVEYYDLHDSKGGLLGTFYADWYPRKGKRDGAWMNPLFTGQPVEPSDSEPHYGVICGNLTPPSGDQPALLTHREVETIFHEFGHLLHHLCSTVSVKRLSGTNVAWDFVELPSQIMENWCWERESLDLFARHYETTEPIPEDLFQKMVRARNFQSAVMTMRQLLFAKSDLELHFGRSFSSEEEVFTFLDEKVSQYRFPLNTEPPTMMPRFTHLFGSSTGYAAGYYSYKYSEMLDADAFSRFLDEGILNANTGADFRNKVLAKGNSEPPEDLFRDFLGRDPDPDALLRRAGLAGTGS